MFVLSKFGYTAKILPIHFSADFLETLVKRIDQDFANFVIIDVGLCISFYDFVKIGASYLMAGDAASYTPIEFRYLVFQPFRGEVLQATILNSTREGLKLTMSFFSDIFIAPNNLQENSRFDETENVWIWEYVSEEGDAVKFYMEVGKTVKFRVTDIKYRTVQPGEAAAEVKVMEILGSMAENGLGCVDWWTTPEEPEETVEDVKVKMEP